MPTSCSRPATDRGLSAAILPWVLVALSCAPAEAPSALDDADPTPTPSAQASAVVEGLAPAASGGFPSVVTLTPVGGEAPEVEEQRRIMGQFGYAFQPGVVVARVGDPVEFANDEDVIHNVHVSRPDGDTVFNVTTLRGIPYVHRFEEPATYAVACNVHPQMAAFVVVTEAPFFDVAAADGAFRIDDVPPGSYELEVWSADPDRRSVRTVEVAGAEVELTLR